MDAGGRLVRAVHDHAGQHGRERRAAVDPAGSGRRSLRARVGGRRLRAHLRGADAHRREDRGRLRKAAHLHHRDRHLHARVAVVRPCELGRSAHRGPCRSGRRRGSDEPCVALDHRCDLPASSARHGDRHLGGCVRARARDRAARRRLAHRASRLELDLLREHPRGHRRGRRQLAAHRRVARRDTRAARRARASPRPRSGCSRSRTG